MTCPICHGAMTIPNPNGIGVEQCPDCKDGKIKSSKMKESTPAKVVFILCLLAWLLWPKHGRAQIRISDYRLLSYDSISIATQTKKDTILVDVLCEFHTWAEVYEPTALSSSPVNHKRSIDGVRIETKAQERTLEWQTVSVAPKAVMFSPGVYGTTDTMSYERKWVVTSTRWLDDVAGCYQLIPLKDE